MPDSPDELTLVVSFLNTVDLEEGTDELETALRWQTWLTGHNLPSSARTRTRALALRESLRAAVVGAVAPPAAVEVTVTLGQDGRPRLTGTDAVSQIAAAAATLGIDGRWERLKICPAEGCRWAFYDITRNRSRQWCSMAVCGARKKSRDFRARRAGRD